MNQRAEIVRKIAQAASLPEQARLVAELDAYDRMNREASASAKSVDWADTAVRQTLQPVAVHERSTIATDWLGEIKTEASLQTEASNQIHVEASLWYGRVSPEVKADSEEFAEQARGMARRIASAHGDQAPALEQEFMQYVSFLNQREAASGLPQVQQVVDSFENKAPTALPADVFDNFAPPVDPINAGVSGTEDSNRAPALNAAVTEAGAPQGVETHHDTVPQPYTYAEVPPGGPADASAGSEPPLYRQSALFTPTVGISHTATLDDFRNGTGIFAEAASGLDQVQQVVDSFEEPDETPLPAEVAFPWITGPDAGGQANVTNPPPPGVNPSVVNRQRNTSEGAERMAAFQRRAAYVATLISQDPNSLTEAQRTEVAQFTALLQKRAASFPEGLNKQADQWSQSGPQYQGPTPANSPMTTPDPITGTEAEGRAEGRSDWPDEAPDYADLSPSIPPFAKGHAEGYQEAAQANPTPGAATPGQMPPGAGGMGAYQTHTGSLKVSASFTSPMDEADPEFKKAYKFATKWKAGDRLVRQGSAAFEAGLYAGISDNPAAQSAWVSAHEKMAKKHGEGFTKRIAMHREFSKQAARNTGLKVEGAYLKTACRLCDWPDDEKWASMSPSDRETWQYSSSVPVSVEESAEHAKHAKTAKTAATEMDLDTMAPTVSPSPVGDTPINGPGQPGPLAGDGLSPARPGGPAPYQGAPPYGTPAVPNGRATHGIPQAISDIPGAPVDKAVGERLNPQTAAFRKRVQANLLVAKQASPKARTAAAKKVPVCNGCGETFESREVANEVHGKNGCGSRDDQNTGYKMTPEDEAW